MTQNALAEIERNIQDAKKMVELGDALERLRSNRDFKKVILDGFFEKEAIRLVHLKSDPSMQTPEKQAAILREMDGIGALSSYLSTVQYYAAQGRKAIVDGEAMREEIAAEGLEA